MSSCACLGVAGSLLLGCSWRFSHWFPQAHWPRTQSARCYALYAGARAIIRQRGGLVAKHGDPPAAAPLDLLHIACLVATCAFELLPCDVRMGVRPAWLVGSSAHRSCVWLDHVRFAAGAPLHALSPKIPHFTYLGDSSALPGSLLAVVMEHGRERHLLQAYHHGTPNITLEARVCECGVAHIYVLAVQVVRPGDPLICASRAWKWAALVAHFDGSCHRADSAGGAGVIVRKFAGDDYEVLAQTAYPLPDCPDSYHAEGFASAYAVQALASLYPSHSEVQECLIIGDNSSILSYWRRTARVRRPALVTVLHQAQLIAATELPRISWRYVPREANKEARLKTSSG